MYPYELFRIFGRPVYLYGICMAVGIIACFAFLIFTMWKMKFNDQASDSVVLIGFFGTATGIFSAALFQSVLNFIKAKKNNPSAKFDWSGMTFLGGLIGGVAGFLIVWNLYMYVIRPRTKIKWLNAHMNATLTDALPFIPIGITIAHGFGRLGCFFAGCCYGKPVDWGLACGDLANVKVIPTQLFEMSFLFLLSAVMAFLYFRYRFYYNFALYPITYGVWRFILEFFRDDDRGQMIGKLQPSQFFSILMVIVGIAFIFGQKYLFSKMMKHPELSQPASADDGGAPATEEVKEEVAPEQPAE